MLKIELSNQNGRIPVWLAVLIILIAIAVIVWLVVTKTTSSRQSTSSQPAPATTQPAVKAPTLSYVGIIQSLGDAQLELLVPASRNGLISDRLVTVHFDEQTIFNRLKIPQQLPAEATGAERQSLFSRATITAEDLQVGDDITVVSESDIEALDSFIGKIIQVMEVQQ